MARFNKSATGSTKTMNHEGDLAYKLDPKMELYTLVCTASLQRKFYERGDETIARLRSLIPRVPAEFVAKLAIYAREQMYLRSIPLVLAVELARHHRGDSLISRMTERVIQRADELTEILAYYAEANGRRETKKLGRLSSQIKKGIAAAFGKFDEYQFAKYNRDGAVKLRDALFLSHAKPTTKEQVALFKKITDDALEVPYTWEVELSKAGQDGRGKREVWRELIDSKKVGYMATLRNLRNILDADVGKTHLAKVAEYIANPDAVRKSRQLPFRFLSAHQSLENNGNPLTSMILGALEDAAIASVENIKGYGYDTTVLIACDTSGSMSTALSPNSTINYHDVGLFLGMMLQHRCKSVITGIFGEEWKVKQLPRNGVLQNTTALRRMSGEVGHSTNGWKALDYLIRQGIAVDKIMVFTDMQLWDSTGRGRGEFPRLWSEYRQANPNAKLYFFDLSGYGTTPVSIHGGNVHLIAGWSDKVFDVLDAIEQGSNSIRKINEITLK